MSNKRKLAPRTVLTDDTQILGSSAKEWNQMLVGNFKTIAHGSEEQCQELKNLKKSKSNAEEKKDKMEELRRKLRIK